MENNEEQVYEPIVWEAPTKIKDAYVTLPDGTELIVTPAKYEGRTPVNIQNLNRMDNAIAYLYENGIGGDATPIGAMLLFSGENAPDGYLIADGQEISRTDYSDLFNIISTTYGEGDGSTTFNIPDYRDRVPVGLNVNTEYFNSLGKKGGESTHRLTTVETPSHYHYISVSSNGTAGGADKAIVSVTGVTNDESDIGIGYSNAVGGDEPHNNLQPYIVTNFIIKAKKTSSSAQNEANSIKIKQLEIENETQNNKIEELETEVEELQNNQLTAEVEGTSIHVEDSANARIISLESEGNCEQVTTNGNQLVDFNGGSLTTGETKTFENDILTIVGDGSGSHERWYQNITNIVKEAGGKSISFHCSDSNYTNENANSRVQLTIEFTDGTTTAYHCLYYFVGKRAVPYTIPDDTSNIKAVSVNIYTNNSATAYENTITITKPMLHFGTDELEYEPYTGGQASPSPDYPQEVEVIEAYNLFDKDNVVLKKGYILDDNGAEVSSTMSGYTTTFIEVEPNTKYTIQGDLCGSYSNTRLYFYDKDKKWIKRTDAILYSAIPYTFTTEDEVYYIQFQAVTDNYDSSTIQINKGELKPYTPYGCIRDKFTGKNRIDTSKFVSKTGNGMTGSVNNDGSIKFTGTTTALSNFWINNLTEVLKAGTYKFVTNIDLTDKGTYSLFDNTSGSNVTINSQKKTSTFTLSEDMTLTTVMIQINSDVTLNDDFYIMLVNENDPEEYEPYQENTLDINLQDNFMAKIGDIADTRRIENGRAILTKRIGKVVLDGSESGWTISETNTSGYNRFANSIISSLAKKPSNSSEVANIISDYFVTVGASDTYSCMNGISMNASGSIYIYFDDFKTYTVDEFKTRLSENPVTLYYQLAEPYEVDLGPVNMPKTYEGVTNVSLIANLESKMKLKYVRSTNVVVDNLAKAIVALGGEV